MKLFSFFPLMYSYSISSSLPHVCFKYWQNTSVMFSDLLETHFFLFVSLHLSLIILLDLMVLHSRWLRQTHVDLRSLAQVPSPLPSYRISHYLLQFITSSKRVFSMHTHNPLTMFGCHTHNFSPAAAPTSFRSCNTTGCTSRSPTDLLQNLPGNAHHIARPT